MNLVSNAGQFNYDGLIADTSFPVQTAGVPVASGQGVLVRGSVLGKTDAGDIILVGGATSATAEYILADDLDTTQTTGNKINAITYVSGAFNRAALIIDGEGTIDNHEADLKKFGLYLKAVL